MSYVQARPLNAAGQAMGPATRLYKDREGRTIREVAEGFDGVAQPADRRHVVKDTQYSVYGVAILTTAPYFLGKDSSTVGGNGDMGMTMTEVDALGRTVRIDAADPNGSQPNVDFMGRGMRTAARTTVSYSGLTTVTTNPKGQTRSEERNVDGMLVRVTDAYGAQLAHQHDAFGNLVETKDALQNAVRIKYDIRGRKVEMTDPDTGTWRYDHDALGQLVRQRSPQQVAAFTQTVMAYDKLGRLIRRAEPEYTSTWFYDLRADGTPCMAAVAGVTNPGKGKLCETSTDHGINRKYAYDSFGRPTEARTSVSNGPGFGTVIGYETGTGRIASQAYPTGLQVSYAYAARGFLSQLTTPRSITVTPASGGGAMIEAGSALWSAGTASAWGRAESQSMHNGVITRAGYEPSTGRVLRLQAGPGLAQLQATPGSATAVLNQSYTWDSMNNLGTRVDANGDGATGAVSESFVHDGLNRLTRYQVAAPAIPNLARTVDLYYNAIGNLLYKSDVGNYQYPPSGAGSVRPHAVSRVVGTSFGSVSYGYDAGGNAISATGQKWRTIAYTSFNLPDGNQGMAGPSGSPRYGWQYDENHQRIKETRADGSGTRTTWYQHPDNQGGLAFESEVVPGGGTSNRHYLSAGGQTIVVVTTGALPAPVAGQLAPAVLPAVTAIKLEYWHKDHQGSVITTTDHAGAVTARYAYDPFGKRRYTNGQYDAFGTLVVDWSSARGGTDRGYTGHEHLDDLGVVYMNGRVFEPAIGRFLQADPFIQQASDLQNYDRYGYCYANPLTCTDPSGFFSLRKVFGSLLLGALDPTGLGKAYGLYRITREVARSEYGYAIGSIAIGIVSYVYCVYGGAVCNGIGQAAWAGFAGQSLGDSIKTGVISGVTSYAFYQVGELTGAGKASVMRGWNTVGHAAVGCASSYASGGSCRSGALSAGFAAAYTNYVGFDKGTIVYETMQHAAVGGVGSVVGGGRFSNGAVTAAFGYLFNECMHTRMCGSDSTTVEIQGNVAAGRLGTLTDPTSIHLSISISDGYAGIVTLDGQPRPGLICTLCLNGEVTFGAKTNIVWGPYELTTPDGITTTSFANSLVYRARLYWDFSLGYSFPELPNGHLGPGRYNSNSWAAGLLQKTMGSAPRLNFAPHQAPGYANPVPTFLFGR